MPGIVVKKSVGFRGLSKHKMRPNFTVAIAVVTPMTTLELYTQVDKPSKTHKETTGQRGLNSASAKQDSQPTTT